MAVARALALHYHGSKPRPTIPSAEAIVLGDYDVMPSALLDHIAGVERLDISDPLSFPFEDLSAQAWTVPLTIHLPGEGLVGSDAASLIALFGRQVFARLTVLDSISATDAAWNSLQQTYGWPNSMRVAPQTFSTNTEVQDANTIEAKRDRLSLSGDTGYDCYPIRSAAGKERLVAVCSVLDRNLSQARQKLYRDAALQLHGRHTSAYVAVMGPGLTTIVEHVPVERLRLAANHPGPPFEIVDLGSSAAPHLTESADIVTGIGNLTRSKRTEVEHAFETMFSSLRVGGTLIIAERLDGECGPNDLIEILLDVSNHDLVMDDMETVKVSSDKAHSFAVLAFTKLGTPVL